MRIYNIILYTNMAEDSVVLAECVHIKSVVEKVYK